MLPIKVLDKTGQKFSRLTVVKYLRSKRYSVWLCRCECGVEIEVNGGSLASGHTKSCGCLKIEKATARVYRHGYAKSPTYNCWYSMHNRCSNPADIGFAHYGGRGIIVCQRWAYTKEGLQNFIADMGERPVGCSLDRIDNNGNYDPGNCRWATQKLQARNRRSNRFVDFQGENVNVTILCEQHGISDNTFLERLKRGWSVERAITSPVDTRRHRKQTDGSTTYLTKTLTTDAAAEPITGVA